MTEDYSANIVLPNFKEWKTKRFYDYEAAVIDYSTLEELNAAINAARIAAFKLNDAINIYERKAKEATINYDRAFSREFLLSTEKTESAKRMRAALKCELIENEKLQNEQIKDELIRTARVLNQEMNILNTLANNLRQQIKIM